VGPRSLSAALTLLLALPALAQSPVIAGCPVFPADSIWNTPVDRLPLDRASDAYVATIGRDRPLHPDFGSGLFNGGPIGIPFVVVPGSQQKHPATFQYAGESDPGPYAVPLDAPIEGGSQSTGDRHAIALDRDNCVLYELFDARPQADGSWRAGSGAIFDLKSHKLRPLGWTSADAAGLPIVPGLVRYEEVAAGEIRHAIRFTAPETRRAYVWPGTHFASRLTEGRYPPMGQRFRLRSDFDSSGFSPETRVILRALQKYGMILADNGSSWFISGAPDERWNNDRLRELRRLRGADFEAVDVSSLMIEPTSAQARPRVTAQNVVNAATTEAGPVAPGEIVNIYGAGLGPESPVVLRLEDGLVATELAGTRVLFDQAAAPLLYVSSTQINAVVPYAVGNTTRMQVQYRGLPAAEAALAVVEAAPGIFAALNEDFTANTSANPARRGSVVILFGTGEGETDPPGVDGSIASAQLARPRASIEMRVGGAPVEVLYAGAAPGLVAGVFQLNARLSPATPPGRQPVLLRIGRFLSPPDYPVFVN